MLVLSPLSPIFRRLRSPKNRSRAHHHRQPPSLANIVNGRPPLRQTPTALVPPSGSTPSPVASFSVPQQGTRVRPRADSLDGPSHSTGGLPPDKKLKEDENSFTESGKYGGPVRFLFTFEYFPFPDHSKAQRR